MQTPPYLLGFTSQKHEITSDDLSVQGSLPEWLNGHLVRTAPSAFEVGNAQYHHWFDGLAMLHRFSFNDRKVNYACRFLESNSYKKAMEKNKIVFGEFGTDPSRGFFKKISSFFTGPKLTDNGCVNINLYGESLAANTETPLSVTFGLDTLHATAHDELDGEIAGQITIAHPHYDRDGTLFSYITKFGRTSLPTRFIPCRCIVIKENLLPQLKPVNLLICIVSG